MDNKVHDSHNPPSAELMIVDDSGNGSFLGNVTAYYSDRRLKKDITPITNAIDGVLKLNGVRYKQNEVAEKYGYSHDDTTKVGVIAQEVQDVLPEAVQPAPFDLNSEGKSKSGKDFLTVQYEKLVPLLIEAIKEQQKQIDELKSIVSSLQSKV